MPRKPHKRANGQGSISYRKAERRWVVRVSIPLDPHDENSPKKRITKYAKTRDEARALRDALLVQVTLGDIEELKPRPRETLSDYVTHWRAHGLQLEIIRGKLRETTADHYERCVRIYAIPVLGEGRTVSSLRPTDADTILMALNRDGKSASTRRQAVIAFRKLARAAAAEGLLAERHALGIHPPEAVRACDPPAVSAEQAISLAALATTTANDGRGALSLQLFTGCRRSEALAARWDGFDNLGVPGAATWRITMGVVEGGGKRGLVFDDPKSYKGRRTVPLPEPAREHLYALRKARPDSVFVSESRRALQAEPRPVMPSNYSRWLRQLFSLVGAVGNSHAMRHAYAINALRAGVPLVTVSRTLGHSSISITADTYMQLEDRDLRNAADAMAAAYAFKPKVEPVPEHEGVENDELGETA